MENNYPTMYTLTSQEVGSFHADAKANATAPAPQGLPFLATTASGLHWYSAVPPPATEPPATAESAAPASS